jgi:fermentation-respiration switch protein FrsA (DUF1100 family)
LGYGGVVGWLRLNEDRMVFQPEAYGGRTVLPVADSLGIRPLAISIQSSDSTKLAGWIIRTKRDAPWVLLCHGNAGNITSLDRQRFYRDLSQFNVNLLAFDYRGYGGSSNTAPTEQGVYDDAFAAYRYLRDVEGVPQSRIVIYGHSLGSAVATYLAARVQSSGLILEGAFTSVPDVGQERFPFAPVRWLAKNHFESAREITRITVPLLVLHARADAIIPFGQGERLFQLAPEPKTFVELLGDHDTAWRVDRSRYLGALVTFIRDATKSPPADPPGQTAPSRPGSRTV